MKATLRGLLIIATIFLGCAKHGYAPAELRAVSDSAANDVAKSVKPASVKHSPVYDSLFRYYRAASEIEQARSAMEDMLSTSAAIIPTAASLNDTIRHELVTKFEQANIANDSLDEVERNLRIGCNRAVDTILRHLSDTAGKASVREYLLRPEVLGARWRPSYDSLSTVSDQVVVKLLSLIDSARGNVIFDSTSNTLRFRDLDLTSRYNAYRDSLAHLGMLEDAARNRGGSP